MQALEENRLAKLGLAHRGAGVKGQLLVAQRGQFSAAPLTVLLRNTWPSMTQSRSAGTGPELPATQSNEHSESAGKWGPDGGAGGKWEGLGADLLVFPR